MKHARPAGGITVATLLFILLATAAPALAADLPLVSSTTYATSLNDGFTCVATGADGAVYAAGYQDRGASGGDSRLVLVKYVDDGTSMTEAWHAIAGDRMSAVKVAVDGDGNVIVAGNQTRAPGSRGSGDIVVFKYSAEGDDLWSWTWDGPGHGLDYVKGLALDSAGNAIVCGSSYGYRTGRDLVTIRLSADGPLSWARRFRGPAANDEARDVTVDDAGNVYVAGRTSERWSATNPADRVCSVIVAYTPQGHRRWVRLDDTARMTSGSTIVYSRAQGCLFFSGTRNWKRGYGVELLLRQLATDNKAHHFWAFGPGGGQGWWPTSSAVDGGGVPAVAGVGGSASGAGAFLAGLTADGEDHWRSAFESTFNDPAWAKFSGVAAGADGRMLAVGESATGAPVRGTRPTAFLVRFSSALPVVAPLDYVGDGGATSHDSCAACAIGDKGMYAVGRRAEGTSASDAVLLKF